MTRKRCVTFSTLTITELPEGGVSDIEDKFILVLPKYPETNEQRRECTSKRCRNRLPPRQKAIVHGHPKAIDHVDDWVQLEKPSPVWREEVKCVDDRSDVEPCRKHHLHNMGHVAVIHVGGGKEECHAQSEDDQCQHRNRKKQPRSVKRMAHSEY